MALPKAFIVITAATIASACFFSAVRRPAATGHSLPSAPAAVSLPPVDLLERMRGIVLAPHAGDQPIDEKIRLWQGRVEKAPVMSLERLGRLFISKARLSNDAGYYTIADQCALYLRATHPGNSEGLLLHGHVMAATHRFAEAEKAARELIQQREHVLDYALLGDALMEQGRLEEAIPVYQQMVDTKPCMESYSRIAHVRWLKGDLEGAIEVMEQAVESASPRDPEPLAWATTRLGTYRFEAGEMDMTRQLAARALELVPDYAAALLLQGKLSLALDQAGAALIPLRAAAARNPLPEYQWTLADALRAAQLPEEAGEVERQLKKRAASNDPRTFALYLATRGELPERAVSLAMEELKGRQDIFTLDALAWACLAAGDVTKAEEHSVRSLLEGTVDARLLLHAGAIAAAAGNLTDARNRLQKADGIRQMLLPSERDRLALELASLVQTSSNTHLQ